MSTASAIHLGNLTLDVSTVGGDDTTGIVDGDTITLSLGAIAIGDASGPGLDLPIDIIKSFTIGGDVYTETLKTITDINRGTTNALTVTLVGSISDSLGTIIDAPASLIFTANQAAGPGVGHAISFSLTDTAGSVPEPSTWAMLMLGFMGLGYAAFRRNAKNRTVAAI